MMLDEAIAECPVVAIVRGVTPDEAVAIGTAFYDAGIRAVETPLNSPDPLESIARLSTALGRKMAVGAGTVLSPDKVEAVAAAGGKFIVAPNTDAAVIHRAVALRMAPAPGFGTASEAFEALGAGAAHLKLFPATTYGPGHLRQLRAVLPSSAVVWAVGGIGPDDFEEWWAAGARAFGLGSDLYKPGLTAEEAFSRASRAVAAARRLGA